MSAPASLDTKAHRHARFVFGAQEAVQAHTSEVDASQLASVAEGEFGAGQVPTRGAGDAPTPGRSRASMVIPGHFKLRSRNSRLNRGFDALWNRQVVASRRKSTVAVPLLSDAQRNRAFPQSLTTWATRLESNTNRFQGTLGPGFDGFLTQEEATEAMNQRMAYIRQQEDDRLAEVEAKVMAQRTRMSSVMRRVEHVANDFYVYQPKVLEEDLGPLANPLRKLQPWRPKPVPKSRAVARQGDGAVSKLGARPAPATKPANQGNAVVEATIRKLLLAKAHSPAVEQSRIVEDLPRVSFFPCLTAARVTLHANGAAQAMMQRRSVFQSRIMMSQLFNPPASSVMPTGLAVRLSMAYAHRSAMPGKSVMFRRPTMHEDCDDDDMPEARVDVTPAQHAAPTLPAFLMPAEEEDLAKLLDHAPLEKFSGPTPKLEVCQAEESASQQQGSSTSILHVLSHATLDTLEQPELMEVQSNDCKQPGLPAAEEQHQHEVEQQQQQEEDVQHQQQQQQKQEVAQPMDFHHTRPPSQPGLPDLTTSPSSPRQRLSSPQRPPQTPPSQAMSSLQLQFDGGVRLSAPGSRPHSQQQSSRHASAGGAHPTTPPWTQGGCHGEHMPGTEFGVAGKKLNSPRSDSPTEAQIPVNSVSRDTGETVAHVLVPCRLSKSSPKLGVVTTSPRGRTLSPPSSSDYSKPSPKCSLRPETAESAYRYTSAPGHAEVYVLEISSNAGVIRSSGSLRPSSQTTSAWHSRGSSTRPLHDASNSAAVHLRNAHGLPSVDGVVLNERLNSQTGLGAGAVGSHAWHDTNVTAWHSSNDDAKGAQGRKHQAVLSRRPASSLHDTGVCPTHSSRPKSGNHGIGLLSLKQHDAMIGCSGSIGDAIQGGIPSSAARINMKTLQPPQTQQRPAQVPATQALCRSASLASLSPDDMQPMLPALKPQHDSHSTAAHTHVGSNYDAAPLSKSAPDSRSVARRALPVPRPLAGYGTSPKDHSMAGHRQLATHKRRLHLGKTPALQHAMAGVTFWHDYSIFTDARAK